MYEMFTATGVYEYVHALVSALSLDATVSLFRDRTVLNRMECERSGNGMLVALADSLSTLPFSAHDRHSTRKTHGPPL